MSCPPDLNSQPHSAISNWFNRLKVAQKIACGYAAVVGVAIAGTSLGIVFSSHQANQAESLRKHAEYEVGLKSHLQTSILQVRTHQQQLIPLLEHPEDFRSEYAHIQHHNGEIEKTWAELEKFVAGFANQTHLYSSDPSLIKFLKTYEGVSAAYFQTLDGLVTEIDFNQIKSPSQIKATQARLLEFTNSDIALSFDAISDDLVDKIKEAEEEEEESRAAMLRANSLRDWILAVSITASSAIAALLAMLISRSITRPLEELEQVAQKVINAQDFSLRSDIFTQDEVGTLATALNQLIEWVEIRTWALEESRDGLEKTVKERTQELSAIIDSLGDGLLVTNSTGQIIRFNPTLLTMFGLKCEQLKGKTCLEVFNGDVTDLVTQNHINPAAFLTSEVS